jgi:hypothetical protein
MIHIYYMVNYLAPNYCEQLTTFYEQRKTKNYFYLRGFHGNKLS